MKKQLFQYAILWHPNEKEEKEGQKSKLIGDIKTVLAKDDKEVLMIASMEIPADYKDKLDNLQIAVKPF